MICAAAGAEGDLTFSAEWPAALLRATKLHIEEELIVCSLEFGAEFYSDSVLLGKSANCAVTDRASKPPYKPENSSIFLRRVEVRA
ncbi:MAG: hypothetical protein AAF360_18075 [Pseudomonadota bacterium]